jgi:hypothetical protein
MGVFDQEASFTLDSTPETEPAAAATSADEGHVDNQGSESQAPETTDVTEVTNETDESTATQEVNKEEKPGEKPSEPKLLAKKYKTMGGLVNGIAEAAKLVGQTINWNDLDSTEEMEETYFDLQRQIGRGEIKRIIMRLHSYLPPIP